MDSIINDAKASARLWWKKHPDYDFSGFCKTRFEDFSRVRSIDEKLLKNSLDRVPNKEELIKWSECFETEIKKCIEKKLSNDVINHAKQYAINWMKNNEQDFSKYNEQDFVDFSNDRSKDCNSFFNKFGWCQINQSIWCNEFIKQIKRLMKDEIDTTQIDDVINYVKQYVINWIKNNNIDISKYNEEGMRVASRMRADDVLNFETYFGRRPNKEERIQWFETFHNEIKELNDVINHAKKTANHWMKHHKPHFFISHNKQELTNFFTMHLNDKTSFYESLKRLPNKEEQIKWSKTFETEIKKWINESEIIRPRCPKCGHSLVVCFYESGKYHIKCILPHCRWSKFIDSIDTKLLQSINKLVLKCFEV